MEGNEYCYVVKAETEEKAVEIVKQNTGHAWGWEASLTDNTDEIGTPEWSMWHSRVESVEDGSQYFFCHSQDNIIDKSTVKQIDLARWDFYKCYK